MIRHSRKIAIQPTNTGTISADISSGSAILYECRVHIGRFIAAGNILRAKRVGSRESLHHNTNYFRSNIWQSRWLCKKLPFILRIWQKL